MKEKKPIAVALSDVHFKLTIQNKPALHIISGAFDSVYSAAEKLGVHTILFPGDIGQSEKTLPNQVFNQWLYYFGKIASKKDMTLIGIDGNHDQCEANFFDKRSPGYFHGLSYAFPQIIKCVNFTHTDIGLDGITYRIFGIPYVSSKDDIKKALKSFVLLPKPNKNILLYHGDITGALDTDGREVGTAVVSSKMFKRFDLTICGHIHKYQKFKYNTVMVGGLTHQRRTDMGCKMGYLIIYDDMSHKFIHLKGYPEFKEYDPATFTPPEGSQDYWIAIDKVTDQKSSVEGKQEKTININNRNKITKMYLRKNKITNPNKIKALFNIINNTEE